jgi:hypothetical protein
MRRVNEMWEAMKQNMGQSLRDFLPEVGAELGRLGRHGSLELAQALFNGHAFTPYGPGQWRPDVEKAHSVEAPFNHGLKGNEGQEQERGGREM